MDDTPQKSITIEDINQLKLVSVSTRIKRHIKRNIFPYVIFPTLYILLFIVILYYYFQLRNTINDNYLVVIFFAIVPPSLPYVYLYYWENREFLTSFAKQLGFSFSPKGDMLSVDGMLFKIGRSQSIRYIISGLYYNHPTRFYNFKTVIGYGKSRHTESFKILEVTFDTLLPEIILSRKFGIFSDMTISRDNEKRLSLEGDFDKYFNLYPFLSNPIIYEELLSLLKKMIEIDCIPKHDLERVYRNAYHFDRFEDMVLRGFAA